MENFVFYLYQKQLNLYFLIKLIQKTYEKNVIL